MTLYCPTCNRSSDECRFIGDFCEFCIAARLKKGIPEHVRIYQCRFCKRLRVGKTFMGEENNMKALGKALRVEIGESKVSKVKVKELTSWGLAKCIVEFNYQDEKVECEAEIKIKTLHQTCQRCYRMSAGYYQAVLQFRGNRMKIEKLVSKAEWFFKKNGGFVTKIEEAANGSDVYVSDKEMATSFFTYVRLKPTRSYRLFGVKNGKEVYRNTYAVHL